MMGAASAHANPQDGVVRQGVVDIEYNGPKLDIYQHTNRAVVDWRSFNIAPNEHTQFHQPSSSSTILNRVTDGNPSQILGRLSANGNVILINPNGVFFGKDSVVDVNGLLATSADILNTDFMNGDLRFMQAGNPNAKVINDGTITAREAGLVGLVAPHVENNGHIVAKLGRVELISGDRFTLDMFGDGLLSFDVSDAVQSQKIIHTGTIEADGGTVILSAAAGKNIVESLIEIKGEIKAPSVAQKNGRIVISAASNMKNNAASIVQTDGVKINVSGQGAGQTGGDVSITADAVILQNETIIDASGDAGGGTILIGGDYLGQGEIQNALLSAVDKNVVLNADAITDGNGGKIVIWADKITEFFGNIFARGGASSGDGGFVEVSGKEFLNYRGYTDTRAANGETGMLLLDPADIVIRDGTGDGAADGTTTFSGNPSATAGTILAGDVGPSLIFQSELEGIAAATNISLAATNSIVIEDLANDALNFAQTSGRSVTFNAGAGGITMQDTNDVIFTAGGAINFITTGNLVVGGIESNGGLVTFNIDGSGDVFGVIAGAGGVTKTGAGDVNFHGANTYSGNTTITNGGLFVTADLGLGTSLLIMNGGTFGAFDNAVTLANDVRLNVNSSGVIAGDQDITFDGIVTNFNGNRTLTVNNTGMTTFANEIHLSQNATNRTLTINGTGDVTISGSLIKGGGGTNASNFTKAGAGNLYLTGTSSYTGTTTLSNAGTLFVNSQASLGGDGLVSLNGGGIGSDVDVTLTNAMRLNNNSRIEGSGNMTFTGAFTNFGGSRTLTSNSTGVTTLAGTVSLSNDATNRTLTITGSGDVVIDGDITNGGSANSSFTKNGTSTVTMNGNNSFTSNLTISNGILYINGTNANATTTINTNGILQVNNDNALGATALLTMAGGTLEGGGFGNITIGNEIRHSTNSIIGGSSDLTLAGIFVNSGGNRTLTINNTANTIFDGDIHMSDSTTNRTVTFAGTGDVILNGNMIKGGGGSDASNFTKTNTGTLYWNGLGTYTGSTNINNGTVQLGASERIDNASGLSINADGVLDLDGHTETVNALTNNGLLLIGNGGSLITNGTQNHINGLIQGTDGTLRSLTAGAITATNVANDMQGQWEIDTTGTVNVINGGDFIVGNVQGSTIILGSDTGNLTLNGQVTATNIGGIVVRLYTTGVFTNNFGAASIDINPASRFLIFSNDSTADTRGGLTGFNRYGCTYNAGAPSCAVGTDIPAAGNGFYMIDAPTLTITGISADNRVYDATTGATLSGVATVDGVLNGDTITFDDGAVTVTFDDKNVGNSKDVTVAGYALTGTNHGYLFVQPTGFSANITPYDLAVTGLTADNKVYNGLLNAPLLGAAAITPLGLDDVTLQGAASGSFANKTVENGKAVTVSGLSITGTDIGNYNLVMPAGLTADITQRPLTVSSFTAANKIFDGNNNATVTSYSFDSAIAGDSILLNNFNATFDDAEIGNNKIVTLNSANFLGADSGNYNFVLGAPTSLASITAEQTGIALPNSYSFVSQQTRGLDEENNSAVQSGNYNFYSQTQSFLSRLFSGFLSVDPYLIALYDLDNIEDRDLRESY